MWSVAEPQTNYRVVRLPDIQPAHGGREGDITLDPGVVQTLSEAID